MLLVDACLEKFHPLYQKMESGGGFYSDDEFIRLDPKWLIDPKLLYVGPRIGEGAHGKVYEGKYVCFLSFFKFIISLVGCQQNQSLFTV